MTSVTSKLLKPRFDQIPDAIKGLNRWIVWKGVSQTGGKIAKKPHDHRTGKPCNAHDPEVWSSFEDISAAYATRRGDGIGVMPGEGVLGVDLDKCRDSQTGVIESWAQEIIDRIGSYSEVSPSGTGVRIFVRGVAHGPRKKKGKVEMYDGSGGNFLTVTGHVLPGPQSEVVKNQEGIDWLYEKFLCAEPEEQVATTPVFAGESRMSDEEVLDAIRASAQASKFRCLYDDGDWERQYTSQSEADLSLMVMLAFWTGSDPEQMERVFSESQLAQRQKWADREDYRQRTIAQAINLNAGNHYHGQGPALTPEEAFASVEGPQGWPEFIPFDERPPEMPRDILPGILGEFAEALAEAIQAPRELAAINALGVVSLAAQAQAVVRVKPDYIEPLNIYGLVTSEPGERKSAVVSACKRPILEWEQAQALALRDEIRRADSHRKTAQKAIEAARQRAARARLPEEREAAKAAVFAMETELPVVPTAPRLLCDDITPEALAEALAAHRECLGVLEAEGGLFETLGGRYNKGIPNLDVVLKSFGGEPVRVDRKGKEPIHLQRPRLTLVLSPQPTVLAAALGNSAFMGRGLVARFMLVLPKQRVGFRQNSKSLDEPLAVKWKVFIRAVLDEPADFEGVEIPLSKDAFNVWLAYADKLEIAQRLGGELEHIRPWASKLSGLTVRIAGLFAIAERGKVSPDPISESTMARAVRFAEWLAEHAKYVFDSFCSEGASKTAKEILEWIQREGKVETTAREIFKALRSRFPNMKSLRPGLDELLERGALVRSHVKASLKGGRTKELYLVNPAVHQLQGDEPFNSEAFNCIGTIGPKEG